MLLRTSVAVMALALSMLPVGRAAAQDEDALQQARESFGTGERLYEQGAYLQAAEAFERSYALMEGQATQYRIAFNVGQANFHADRWADARVWFERYLEHAAPDDEFRGHAETMVREARTREGDGREGSSTVSAGEASPVEPVALDVAARPRTDAGGDDIAPWVVVGAGAAIAIVGAITLGLGLSDRATVEDASQGAFWMDGAAEAYDRGPALLTSGVVLLPAGVLLAAVGVVWALVTPAGNGEQVSLRVGPGSIALSGAF